MLVNRLRPQQVWVPSYLCPEGVLGGIDSSLTILRFFEVDDDLQVCSDRWVSEVAPGDLVIFIDYFGFPYDRQLAIRVKEKGGWILEDACQALLSRHVGKVSDFVLFSIVKWIGAPDGGILRFTGSMPINSIFLEPPETVWWLKTLQASVLRREFDDGLPTRQRWFKLFGEIKDTMPVGPYAMSELSQTIMKHGVIYSPIAERRLMNYRTLLEKLGPYALFPRIEPDVVPLGFPIRVANRDSVRQALFAQKIYPPVHWDIDGVVPRRYEGSHRLAGQIMTLPCDQRYGREDMERMAETFLEIAANHE